MIRAYLEKEKKEINFMLASNFRVEPPLILMIGDEERIVGAVKLDSVSWIIVHDGALKEKRIFGMVRRLNSA
ncbi:MAG: hypothetical protein ABIT01_13305 [Thermoanaerobaculia bacterium]